MKKKVFNRVVIKLSGEALSRGKGYGLCDKTIDGICEAIAKVHKSGIEEFTEQLAALEAEYQERRKDLS